MTDWDAIRKEFEETTITMKALAEKHGVKPSTLRSRKNREDWQRGVATQRNKKKSVATQKVVKELNENSELTEKQKQFCLLYLHYFNATKAYKEVYEVDYGTAKTNGNRMLTNAHIKTELARLKEEQLKELYVDSLDIKREWIKQAFADMTDFVEFKTIRDRVMEEVGYDEETGEPMLVEKERAYSQVLLKHSEEVDGTLIQEVKQGRDGISLKLYDKQKAMQELMKFMSDPEDTESIVIVDGWGDNDV